MLLWSALKQLLWEVLLIKVITTWKNLPKHYVYADFLLILSYIQGALRKELLIASFVELFKNANLRKSY